MGVCVHGQSLLSNWCRCLDVVWLWQLWSRSVHDIEIFVPEQISEFGPQFGLPLSCVAKMLTREGKKWCLIENVNCKVAQAVLRAGYQFNLSWPLQLFSVLSWMLLPDSTWHADEALNLKFNAWSNVKVRLFIHSSLSQSMIVSV